MPVQDKRSISTVLPLKFSEDTCARCSQDNLYKGEREGLCYPVTKLAYLMRSHPRFVPKYTGAQKFFGGVGHMATLGIGLMVEKISTKNLWPGFTNSDEICTTCKNSPGSNGCLEVGIELEKRTH